jgi:hypothetical protein
LQLARVAAGDVVGCGHERVDVVAAPAGEVGGELVGRALPAAVVARVGDEATWRWSRTCRV